MYEGELCGVQTQARDIGFAFKSRMTVKGVAVNGATEPFGAMHTQWCVRPVTGLKRTRVFGPPAVCACRSRQILWPTPFRRHLQ